MSEHKTKTLKKDYIGAVEKLTEPDRRKVRSIEVPQQTDQTEALRKLLKAIRDDPRPRTLSDDVEAVRRLVGGSGE